MSGAQSARSRVGRFGALDRPLRLQQMQGAEYETARWQEPSSLGPLFFCFILLLRSRINAGIGQRPDARVRLEARSAVLSPPL